MTAAKRELRPAPEPIEANDVALVTGMTIASAVAAVVLWALHGTLAAHGQGWWPWSGVAGAGLGLFGIWYCRRRRDAIARDRAARAAAETDPTAETDTAAGPDGPGDRDAGPGAGADREA